jgi:hypothetical protein
MIVTDHGTRKTHVGRHQETQGDGVLIFKDDTLAADDKAFFLKVRDFVQDAVSEVTFKRIAERMQRSLGIKLAGDPVKSVDAMSTKFLLNEEERNGVLRHLLGGGDLSGYGLINAVTHYSQEVPDYDRATDFEVMGGKLLALPVRDWKEITEAA